MKTVKKRSPFPVYGIAAVWLLLTVFRGMSRISDILIAVVASVVVYFVLLIVFPTKIEEVKIETPPEPLSPEMEELKKERDRAISEMRRLNDSIKDEKISRQIDHLEETTAKIFDLVMEKPEKQPQIRRFLNYFLPTTIKLLNAYDRADSTGISGSNIDSTKSRVETMLDEICDAFDRQLDALFADEALDISTDIKVMESMLAQEGLSDYGGVKMGGH